MKKMHRITINTTVAINKQHLWSLNALLFFPSDSGLIIESCFSSKIASVLLSIGISSTCSIESIADVKLSIDAKLADLFIFSFSFECWIIAFLSTVYAKKICILGFFPALVSILSLTNISLRVRVEIFLLCFYAFSFSMFSIKYLHCTFLILLYILFVVSSFSEQKSICLCFSTVLFRPLASIITTRFLVLSP